MGVKFIQKGKMSLFLISASSSCFFEKFGLAIRLTGVGRNVFLNYMMVLGFLVDLLLILLTTVLFVIAPESWIVTSVDSPLKSLFDSSYLYLFILQVAPIILCGIYFIQIGKTDLMLLLPIFVLLLGGIVVEAQFFLGAPSAKHISLFIDWVRPEERWGLLLFFYLIWVAPVIGISYVCLFCILLIKKKHSLISNGR